MSTDSTGEVAVDRTYKLRKIDENTPKGVKLLLANKGAGVTTTGVIKTVPDYFFTHWGYCPVFEDD